MRFAHTLLRNGVLRTRNWLRQYALRACICFANPHLLRKCLQILRIWAGFACYISNFLLFQWPFLKKGLKNKPICFANSVSSPSASWEGCYQQRFALEYYQLHSSPHSSARRVALLAFGSGLSPHSSGCASKKLGLLQLKLQLLLRKSSICCANAALNRAAPSELRYCVVASLLLNSFAPSEHPSSFALRAGASKLALFAQQIRSICCANTVFAAQTRAMRSIAQQIQLRFAKQVLLKQHRCTATEFLRSKNKLASQASYWRKARLRLAQPFGLRPSAD